MIYVASIPRCGSTYLVRSIAGLPQGGSTPDDLTEKYGIVKTHRVPRSVRPSPFVRDDAVVFVFGPIVEAVVSTAMRRWDERHFENCDTPWDENRDRDPFAEDVLGYENIWRQWIGTERVSVLAVHYEALFDPDARSSIETWVGRRIAWLPRRPRTTRASIRVREKIRKTYRRLVVATDVAPKLFVINP